MWNGVGVVEDGQEGLDESVRSALDQRKVFPGSKEIN
jgi:hypothetical protein